jgi:hypothetical protein
MMISYDGHMMQMMFDPVQQVYYFFRSANYTLSIYGGPYSRPIRATHGV